MRKTRNRGDWRSRFRGMYWRQLFVTTGMVLLTLALLGVLFFSLSYRYTHGGNRHETEARTENFIRVFAREYLGPEAGTLTDLRASEAFHQLTAAARETSGIRLLFCDREGQVIMEDQGEDGAAETAESTVPRSRTALPTIPADLTAAALGEEGFAAGWWTWKRAGTYYLAGVPAFQGADGPLLAFAASPEPEQDTIWHSLGLLYLTIALVVLLIAAMAASVTAMHLANPLRDMTSAARSYAQGEFERRIEDAGQVEEIGDLAAAFNQMADALQRQEQQRREFISNVSHDLKTPLTTIAGYTDGILDGTIPPDSQRKYLEIISQESRRLSRMVRRMLDVSQLQAIDPLRSGTRFDICECMRRVLISMEQRIRDRRLDVDADIPEEPILTLGDQDMITQVIYNLLENAVKFARAGSTLYLGVAERDGRARVLVRNRGETIPPEELPLLFERFHKSDKSRGEDKDGVGLGLYIVKTILEQHKENIYAASEKGVTTFSFSLRTDRGNGL